MTELEAIEKEMELLQRRREIALAKGKVRKQVLEIITEANLTVEDIFPELQKPAPAPAPTTKSSKPKVTRTPKDKRKYIHRDDPSLTYGGRGPKPQWVIDAEAAGNLDDHLNPNYVDPTATPTVAPTTESTTESTGGLGKEQVKAMVKNFTS